MVVAPLDPVRDIPVDKVTDPLTPLAPEFEVARTSSPLVVVLPNPLQIEIAPPVFDVDMPADTSIEPPTPEVPEPTVIEIKPPRPLVAASVPIEI